MIRIVWLSIIIIYNYLIGNKLIVYLHKYVLCNLFKFKILHY